MIIYNGSNSNLEGLISPHEKKIKEALQTVLGRKYYRQLDELSDRLLNKHAFYEPETAQDTLMLDLMENETIKMPKPQYSAAAMTGLRLQELNEVYADELARRISVRAGFYQDEWGERFGEMHGTNGIEESLMGMTDEKFMDALVFWQRKVAAWRKAYSPADRFISSASAIKFVRRPPEKTGTPDAILSVANDMLFGINIVDGNKVEYSGGEIRVLNSSRITTEPSFCLPKAYNPQKMSPVELKNPELFRLCAYVHEYGHFAEYALQVTPLQAVGAIAMSAGFFQSA